VPDSQPEARVLPVQGRPGNASPPLCIHVNQRIGVLMKDPCASRRWRNNVPVQTGYKVNW
jgi:hypothetical protein